MFAKPRRPRLCPAGTTFHLINRAVARLTLFKKIEDDAFERVLRQAYEERHCRSFPTSCCPITGTLWSGPKLGTR